MLVKKVAVEKKTLRLKKNCSSQVYKCGAIAAWKPRQKCSAWDFEFYASKTRYQNVHGSTFWGIDTNLAFGIISSQDTRHKTQDTRHKTQDTRHKTQDTRHKTQDTSDVI